MSGVWGRHPQPPGVWDKDLNAKQFCPQRQTIFRFFFQQLFNFRPIWQKINAFKNVA